jgi:Ca2+-binding RTX toxin-like protein
LTITGSQKTNVYFSTQFGTDGSSTTSDGVSLIDASALTGKLLLNTTNIKTAYAGVAVKGGSNDDTITITAQAAGLGRFTVDAGAGNDTIITGTAASTLTGGSGNDIFDVTLTTAGPTSSPVFTTITDYTAGDSIKLGTTTATAAGKTLVVTATSLTSALDLALKGSSVSAGVTTWFTYGGDTYVAAEDSTDGYSSGDIIVKLTGISPDFTWSSSESASGLLGQA